MDKPGNVISYNAASQLFGSYLYVLILARLHTSKAVLLHYVTPVLAPHRLHASPVSKYLPA